MGTVRDCCDLDITVFSPAFSHHHPITSSIRETPGEESKFVSPSDQFALSAFILEATPCLSFQLFVCLFDFPRLLLM